MDKKIDKSWFEVNGTLRRIDFDGDSHFRFPDEVAERVLNTYSEKNHWVLDPFAGFGTTLHVAQSMGRNAVGIELDAKRAEFAKKGLIEPNKVIQNRAENVGNLKGTYIFDLVFTSPPYMSVRLEDDPWGKTYSKI